MNTKKNLVLFTGAVIFAAAGAFEFFWFSYREWLVELFPGSAFYIFVILSWFLSLGGIFTIIMFKGGNWGTFISGAKYGAMVGCMSLIVQLIYFAGLVAKMITENITMLNNSSSEVVKSVISANYILLGVNLFSWISLFGGGGLLALNALRFVLRLKKNSSATNWLEESDWGSAAISFSVFITLLISMIETDLLSLFGSVFQDQSSGWNTKWIVLSLILAIASLMLFALSITVNFLLSKKQHIQVPQVIELSFGILALLSAISLGIGAFLQNIKKTQNPALLSVIVPFIFFLIFLWPPRYTVKLLGIKSHKILRNVSIWIRIIGIPIIVVYLVNHISDFYFLSTTISWLVITFGILGVYYIYIGLLWAFSLNKRVHAWMETRTMHSAKSNVVEEKVHQSKSRKELS